MKKNYKKVFFEKGYRFSKLPDYRSIDPHDAKDFITENIKDQKKFIDKHGTWGLLNRLRYALGLDDFLTFFSRHLDCLQKGKFIDIHRELLTDLPCDEVVLLIVEMFADEEIGSEIINSNVWENVCISVEKSIELNNKIAPTMKKTPAFLCALSDEITFNNKWYADILEMAQKNKGTLGQLLRTENYFRFLEKIEGAPDCYQHYDNLSQDLSIEDIKGLLCSEDNIHPQFVLLTIKNNRPDKICPKEAMAYKALVSRLKDILVMNPLLMFHQDFEPNKVKVLLKLHQNLSGSSEVESGVKTLIYDLCIHCFKNSIQLIETTLEDKYYIKAANYLDRILRLLNNFLRYDDDQIQKIKMLYYECLSQLISHISSDAKSDEVISLLGGLFAHFPESMTDCLSNEEKQLCLQVFTHKQYPFVHALLQSAVDSKKYQKIQNLISAEKYAAACACSIDSLPDSLLVYVEEQYEIYIKELIERSPEEVIDEFNNIAHYSLKKTIYNAVHACCKRCETERDFQRLDGILTVLPVGGISSSVANDFYKRYVDLLLSNERFPEAFNLQRKTANIKFNCQHTELGILQRQVSLNKSFEEIIECCVHIKGALKLHSVALLIYLVKIFAKDIKPEDKFEKSLLYKEITAIASNDIRAFLMATSAFELRDFNAAYQLFSEMRREANFSESMFYEHILETMFEMVANSTVSLSVDENGDMQLYQSESECKPNNTVLFKHSISPFKKQLQMAGTMDPSFEPEVWRQICASQYIFNSIVFNKIEPTYLVQNYFKRVVTGLNGSMENGECEFKWVSELNMPLFRFLRLIKFYYESKQPDVATQILRQYHFQDNVDEPPTLNASELKDLEVFCQSTDIDLHVCFVTKLMELEIDKIEKGNEASLENKFSELAFDSSDPDKSLYIRYMETFCAYHSLLSNLYKVDPQNFLSESSQNPLPRRAGIG